nr:integrase, catalytic region, zinc finger, CCHC-type, peptidase aspartic, catalytic [Tanacetum cinerariifolium]
PNGEALRKCILSGPYKPTTVLVQAIDATDDSPAIPVHTTVETPMNMSPENKAYFESEKEAIYLILTGIRDEIYSTIDACQTAQEMWEAIEGLQQGKEIAKPITHPSEIAFEEDSDPEQAQRDKDMQKNLALIAKYFKKIYKPTNNNLRTSSNSKNKNVDTTPCLGFSVLTARNLDILPRNAESRKGLKTLHTDEEVDEQELEAHYSYMAKIQEVPTADTCTDSEPVEQVQNEAEYNVFANDLQHYEQSESVSNTCLVETDDSNVIPNSPDMCKDDIQNDQNDVESDAERVALANLKLDVDENKKIQKQLKKANTTLAQELKECKAILTETSKSLGESISVRDSFLVALQNKQTEFEKYNSFNNRTVDYDKLERKLNETLGQLAQKNIKIKEGLKTKAYEISVVKEKHDELIKQSLLTKSHYEGLVKQKTKVITDLKLREEHDIDKMLSMEKQLKFLNEIVYKRSQPIQTIHMMAPKVPTYNGRPTFANPRYLKQAQSEIPCLYAFPYDQFTHANRLIPDGEETLALERESRSKLNKDLVTCLMPLAIKTQNDSFLFVHELKQEMHADLKYVESLEKEIDELESNKVEFSNMYDMILQECVFKDVMCSYLLSLSDLDALNELQCLYLHKVKECDCLAQKLSSQTESVSKEVHSELLKCFAKVEKHSISLEIALQKCKEQRLIEKGKGKSVDTKFDKPFVVRQPNAQRIPKPLVLEGLSKPVTAQTLPQTARRAVSNINVLKPGMYRIDNRTLNANAVCATCNKCLVDSNHCGCVTKMLNDVNARTKKPNVVPISTRKPKSQANKSVATPHKKKVASKSNNKKPQSYFRMLYEQTSKAWKWWIEQQSPSGYKWVPKTKMKWVPKPKMQWVPKAKNENVQKKIVQLILFIVDSGCTKQMTGNLKLLCNFVKKFLGTVCFGNDQFAPILGYGDLVQGNVTINRVYYVEGLNHNLFSVGHFCDADLEVAFRKSTCFVRDLQGNDLLTGNRGSDLYTISLQESTSSTPLCLMAKATPTQACKAKRSSFKSKAVPSSKGRLNLLHMDLCGPMRVASINGKKYILASDYDNSDLVLQRQDVSSSTDTNFPSQQELDLLFGPLYDEFFNAGSTPQDKQPTIYIQPTSAPFSPTYVHAEENNDNQAEEHLPDDEFTNPFCASAQDVAESSSHNIEKVYRLKKALYGLKQALMAWCNELSKFLTSKGFTKGLQIHQSPHGIFINQARCALDILHKHGMDKGQSIGTPMATKPKLDADLSGNPGSSFDLIAFSDADHVGCIDSRKSTSGGIQFLGDKLVSWMSKKQNCTAISSAEAEYVTLSASCAQVTWMRTQLQDYGFNINKISLYCDSQSAIAISCNPIQYSHTKHIHTRYQ